LQEVVRKYFDTLKNSYTFFSIYANIDQVAQQAGKASASIDSYLESKAGEPERFDRWIWSKYNSLVEDVTSDLNSYEITRPVRAIQQFVIEELSNWYVRNNRRRFWAKGDDPSKMRAYLTLYRVLEGVCRLTAPVTPFISELLWTELTGANRCDYDLPLSVHMTDYPASDKSAIDANLEEAMGLSEKIVSLGRAARSRKNLKVRQPLSRIMIQHSNPELFDALTDYLPIIRDELNIKEVIKAENLDEYAGYTAKLNFRAAGPKLGQKVKAAAAALENRDEATIAEFVSTGILKLDLDGETVSLSTDEVTAQKTEKAGYAVETDGPVTVALATELSEELIDEGFARELINKIQNMRKTTGFEVTDHISITVSCTSRLRQAAERHDEFIRRETLAEEILFRGAEPKNGKEWNINGEKTAIALAKI
jgi:isoleucyl-tRNA synthetase